MYMSGNKQTQKQSMAHAKLTRAGRRVASEIEKDSGDGKGILSGDGPDSYKYLRALLIKLNRVGGLVTTCSQAIVDDAWVGRVIQRPFIHCVAHESLLNIFRMMSTEDNIAIYINRHGVVPVTWEISTEEELVAFVRKYGDGARRSPIAFLGCDELQQDRYLVQSTCLWSSSVSHVENGLHQVNAPRMTLSTMEGELLDVEILWTKTSDIQGFVRAVEKYFDNPPRRPRDVRRWASY